ncbi:hypothetical protein DFX49_RS20865, partial [Vibrio parahaemolyticus]|nr:hypothetical protein [Vibrio parahaemolyticus]
MTKKSTETQLRQAFERLKANTPTNRKYQLKVKANKPLRITKSGVEKEAGLSNGALKHYPELIREIEDAEAERIHGSSDSQQELAVDDVKSSPIYKQLEAKLERCEEERKKAKITIARLSEECDRKDAALNEKIAEIDELITSMWQQIPREA